MSDASPVSQCCRKAEKAEADKRVLVEALRHIRHRATFFDRTNPSRLRDIHDTAAAALETAKGEI